MGVGGAAKGEKGGELAPDTPLKKRKLSLQRGRGKLRKGFLRKKGEEGEELFLPAQVKKGGVFRSVA